MLNKQKNFSKRIQDLFERLHGRKHKFPKYIDSFRRFFKTREEVAVQYLPGGDKILDLGCGEGWLLRKVASRYKNCVGVDVASSRIEKAKIKTKKEKINNIKFLVANIEEDNLPFKDEEFDAITCIGVLEYLFDPYFTIHQINHLLKKKGILIIQVSNLAYLPNRFQLLFGKLPGLIFQEAWEGGRLHNFTKSSLEKLLTDNGFKILKKTCSGFFPSFRRWWLSLLSADLIFIAEKK